MGKDSAFWLLSEMFRGLSGFCQVLLGKPLSKVDQVSDWWVFGFILKFMDLKISWYPQACDLRHYSLFSLMSSKLTLFTLFLIFETLFIIFVKFRHYLNELDIICLN